MDPDEIAAIKDELRDRIRAERRAEPDSARDRRRALLANLADDVLSAAAHGGAVGPIPVAAFQPIVGEPDISALLNELRRRGCEVLLPRPHGQRLEWVAAEHEISTCPKQIPRPPGPSLGVGAEPLETAEVGLVLVPALAVDPTSGTRVGYGLGYYDRLLEHWRGGPSARGHRPLLVGVVRRGELVKVPAAPHDVAVDAVLTEDGLVACGQAHDA